MYTPQNYQTHDINEAFELIISYPFATLISVQDQQPYISHLPLTPQRQGDQIYLIGHLAKANPHWKFMTQNKLTAIFHGPHTYVTPKWYAENDVPTWNYTTLHTTGKVELIENSPGLIDCLKTLTTHTEKVWPSGWEFFIPDDLIGEALPQSIVGFKITVEKMLFKKKMSQNRSNADRVGIIAGLESRSDEQSQNVRKIMQEMYDVDGQLKK